MYQHRFVICLFCQIPFLKSFPLNNLIHTTEEQKSQDQAKYKHISIFLYFFEFDCDLTLRLLNILTVSLTRSTLLLNQHTF